MNDSLPLDPGFLEIDEQTQSSARGSQVVEALRGVFVGETFGAFQLDDQPIFHENIGKVFSHAMPLVSYWKWDFGMSPDAPKAELVEQSTLVDLLEEARAQGVGDLENSSEHTLGQGVEASAFIVHQRPIKITVPSSSRNLKMIIGRG